MAAAPPVDAQAIDAAVRHSLEVWQAPGVAVGIVRDGEVVYLKGHGVREVGGKDAVTPDTLFPIASCTKAFTTAAMAVLVDEGKMGWDDPVRKHVPFFRLSDPLADANVTLRDLVCHRTGLAGHDLLWYHSPWSIEETVRRAGRLPLIVLGHALGARVVGYYFESRVEDCLERNRARAGKARVPDVVLYATRKRLEAPSCAEGFDALYFVRMDGGGWEVTEWERAGDLRSDE